MSNPKACWVVILVVSILSGPALVTLGQQAIPGDLDPTFGTGGKVTTDFGPGSNSAGAVAVQADGKIVAAGASGSGDFALARYNEDGSPDTSFDGDGKVTTDFGGSDRAFAVAIQADGKIIAAGTTAPGGFCCQFALARYNPDGSPDTSFDGDGKVTTVFTGITEARGVAIQADGKIVAAGGTFSPFGSGFALTRYNMDGSLDTSFDGDGKLTTDFGGSSSSAAAVAIQADGKIVAAGAGGPSNDFALARYNPDGSLDTSFDGDGMTTVDFGGFDAAADVAIQVDDKLVTAGRGVERFALARLNPDGSLDTSFDADGKVTTQFFGENVESAAGLALQTDGKIVVAGTAFSAFDPSFALARYNMDGSLDTSFGGDGKVTTDFGDPADVGVLCPPGRKDCSEDNAADVAIQPDGKIVAVGGAGPCTPSCLFALARYLGEASATATEVTIDVKPGSRTNPIKLSSAGLVPIAILSTETFDATTVDPSTICFGDDDNPSQRDCTEAHGRGHRSDVNGDGRVDLVLHYEISQTGIDPGDTTACLTGKTSAGIDIEGCDAVRPF